MLPSSSAPCKIWPLGGAPGGRHDPIFRSEVHFAVFRRLAVWLSGNALASINVVPLRQTRLVLGWVTVCGRVNHFGM